MGASSKPPPDAGAAVALVLEHIERIDDSWSQSEHKPDVLGVLRVDSAGTWFVGMSGRQEVLGQSPDILQFFPQLGEPAWEAEPSTSPGNAMWLIVRSPEVAACVRLRRSQLRRPNRERN